MNSFKLFRFVLSFFFLFRLTLVLLLLQTQFSYACIGECIMVTSVSVFKQWHTQENAQDFIFGDINSTKF